jgi:uncharacterized membrane protein
VTERDGVERLLARIDFVRGLGGLLLLAGIGVAAVVAGGLAGWLLGAVFLAVAVALFVALVRRPS